MLQNYHYFIVLAETLNISEASRRLYISHQCLSRYLKTLEDECGLALFARKPSLRLTPAGEILLNSLKEIRQIEQNTKNAFSEINNSGKGEVRLGITEGRLRIFLPILVKKYHSLFPDVDIKVTSKSAKELQCLLLDNKLDLVLSNYPSQARHRDLEYKELSGERILLVISDNLMREYFPEQYPECIKKFKEGVFLSDFINVPFCAPTINMKSRQLIDAYMKKENIRLNFLYEATQQDLLHLLTSHDYAASFCLSMYVSNLDQLNQSMPINNQLHTFPIMGLEEQIPFCVVTRSGMFLPSYVKTLVKLIQDQCDEYMRESLV